MDIAKIQDLKRRLAECTDFGAFWTFYFDNFAENKEFLNIGRQVTGRRMHQLFAEVGARVLGETGLMVLKPILVEQPESGLIHGSCMVRRKVMCILFFTDLDMGMAAVSDFEKGGTVFARFSITSPKAIAAAN